MPCEAPANRACATFPFPLPSQSDRHPIRLAFLESQFATVPLALWAQRLNDSSKTNNVPA
jgi:hypothetical protein